MSDDPAAVPPDAPTTANEPPADRRCRNGRPRLVTVCGYPGVGKSSVARIVADRIDGRVLRTDRIRKDRFPDPEYTEEETRAVYEELLSRAEATVRGGRNVVLDGTFYRQTFRDRTERLAGQLDADHTLIRIRCDPSVVEERIRTRKGVSDADIEVYRTFQDIFEPVKREHVAVDNSGDLDETRQQVLDRLFPE